MKALLFSALLLSTLISFAQTPDFTEIYGYAAMEGEDSYYQEGGTTGGAGGTVVYPTTLAELQTYAESDDPYIVMIDGTIQGPGVVAVGSNTTILGVGSDAFIWQICLQIQCKHNIIIRNIIMSMLDVEVEDDGENKIVGTNTDPDCIAMQADDDDLDEEDRITHHIWIDHCEFYNEDPAVMTDKDRYDGLTDMKNDCQYITISWCYYHDHHKACLFGKGSSDEYDRTVTMVHNRFVNIASRIPLQRFGYVHFGNNLVDECDNGYNARINAIGYIDYNYFRNTAKPVFGKVSEGGAVNMVENVFEGDDVRLYDDLSDSEKYLDTDWVPPYLDSWSPDAAEDVPDLVEEWSGVGKLEDPEYVTLTVEIPTNGSISPTTSDYPEDSQVAVTATADDGYTFAGWTGDLADSTSNPTTILMDADKTISATFTVAEMFDVEVSVSGNGILSDDVSGSVAAGTELEVTAIPYIGSEFTGWTGSVTDTLNTLSLEVNSDISIVANFAETTEPTTYEFEDGYYEDGIAAFEDTHTPFSGTGYVNTENDSATWTEITVYAPAAADYSCEVFHSHETDDRGDIIIWNKNTDTETSVSLPASGSWDVWTSTVFTLALQKGENVLRFIGDSDMGAPNLDKLEIEETESTADTLLLQAGWNLVGCPIEGTTDIETAFSSIWNYVTSIKDADNYYLATNPAFLNTLDSVIWGKGYLIKVSEDCELTW